MQYLGTFHSRTATESGQRLSQQYAVVVVRGVQLYGSMVSTYKLLY